MCFSSSTTCPLSQHFYSAFPCLLFPDLRFPVLLSCLILFTSPHSPHMIAILPRALQPSILPLPPFLSYICLVAVLSSSSPTQTQLTHRCSIVTLLLYVCVCVCVWKLTGFLGFYPRSVTMTLTHPQLTKAANERMAVHFLIPNCMEFKEAQDNLTQKEENRQIQTERGRDKEEFLFYVYGFNSQIRRILFVVAMTWSTWDNPARFCKTCL